MQASMENMEGLDTQFGLSVGMPIPSNCNVEGNGICGSDSTFHEKSLLDEIDSYWDDLNTRLTISRMVSNSVIKGMVNAVVEEAAEKITLKEAELAILSGRLQHYESDETKDNSLDSLVVMPEASLKVDSLKIKSFHHLQSSLEENHAHRLEELRIAIEEQLQKLQEEIKNIGNTNSLGGVNACSGDSGLYNIHPRETNMEKLHVIDECTDAFEVILSTTYQQISGIICSLKVSRSEQQWEQEFQREIDTIIVRNLVKELQDGFETKLCEQRGLITIVNKKRQEKVGELSTMRQELDAISKGLFSSESGLLVSHNSLKNLEECIAAKRKDHLTRKVLGNQHLPCAAHAEENSSIQSEESVKPTASDSPQLKRMEKEELITYFKTEMNKMKRQHDLALQEKTEELFVLKREFLNEKGSTPLHFRKDKVCEQFMRKISEFLSKLDDILLENENLPIIHDDHDILYKLKERIDILFFENQQLKDLLKDKTKEATCFASQVLGAENQISHYSSIEAKFSKQIDKLQSDLEDVKIGTTIREEVNKSVLRELVCEIKSDMEGLEMVTTTEQDICSMIYREVVGDALSIKNPIIAKYCEDMSSIAAGLLEKEKALSSKIEENMRLKQEITSLSTLMKEKEKVASETESTLMQQTERFDLLCQELNILSDRVNEQEIYISESKREFALTRGSLDEALQQIHQYEVEMSEVKQKLKTLSDALEEAEKEKLILHGNIQEKQKALTSAIAKEKEQKKWMDTIICSMTKLSKAIVDFECKFADDIKINESRLKLMNHHCIQLVQEVNLLKRKELWYKQRFERRCSDLQKAEIEVDLLGDEVDTLLSLLEKIYLALDHYSEVLQHYPGVVEILRVIRREMKGKDNKLV